MNRIADALIELCGADYVRAGAAASRVPIAGVAPAAVVAPRDEAAVAAVLARCSENGWTVEPAGGCTWLAAGRRPARADVLLTTTHLAEVRPAAAADGVITAGAGASLDEVAAALRGTGQQVPLDPPAEHDATIGAAFATASAGPLRFGYGTPRDLALGLTVATGDGRVLSFGGTVVKNVAGYDLVRLLVGSRGSLGVITRLHVRLRPLPEDDATVLLPVDAAAATELARAIGALAPVALELLSPELVRRASGRAGWILAARFHGAAEAVADAVAAATAALHRTSPGATGAAGAEGGGRPAGARLDAREAAQFWERLGRLEARATFHARFAAKPAALESTLGAALRVAESTPAAGWCVAAHAGDGVVRAWLTGAIEPQALVDIARAATRERDELESRGGSLLVPVAPAETPDDFEPFGALPDPAIQRIEAALRAAFDPAGILAPGRFSRGPARPEPAHV